MRRAAGTADDAGERVRLVEGLGEGRTGRRADDDQHVDRHVGAWLLMLCLRPRDAGEAVEHRADEFVEPHDRGIAGVRHVWAAAGDGADERHLLFQLLECLVAMAICKGQQTCELLDRVLPLFVSQEVAHLQPWHETCGEFVNVHLACGLTRFGAVRGR